MYVIASYRIYFGLLVILKSKYKYTFRNDLLFSLVSFELEINHAYTDNNSSTSIACKRKEQRMYQDENKSDGNSSEGDAGSGSQYHDGGSRRRCHDERLLAEEKFKLGGLSGLQTRLLTYRSNNNKIAWYFQALLTAHYVKALALTQGERKVDVASLDALQSGAEKAAHYAPAQLATILTMSSYFLEMIKKIETQEQVSLALAYAALGLSFFEFSLAVRLIARKLDSKYASIEAKPELSVQIAQKLVEKIEAGMVVYGNPYAFIEHFAGISEDPLDDRDLGSSRFSQQTLLRIRSVYAYLNELLEDTSIQSSVFSAITSKIRSMFSSFSAEGDVDSILQGPSLGIRPPSPHRNLELFYSDPQHPYPNFLDKDAKNAILEGLDLDMLCSNSITRVGADEAPPEDSIVLSEDKTLEVLTYMFAKALLLSLQESGTFKRYFKDKDKSKEFKGKLSASDQKQFIAYFLDLVIKGYARAGKFFIQELINICKGNHLITDRIKRGAKECCKYIAQRLNKEEKQVVVNSASYHGDNYYYYIDLTSGDKQRNTCFNAIFDGGMRMALEADQKLRDERSPFKSRRMDSRSNDLSRASSRRSVPSKGKKGKKAKMSSAQSLRTGSQQTSFYQSKRTTSSRGVSASRGALSPSRKKTSSSAPPFK